MREPHSDRARARQGITVLGLLLLIIALIIAGVLLVRYLRERPSAAWSVPALLSDGRVNA